MIVGTLSRGALPSNQTSVSDRQPWNGRNPKCDSVFGSLTDASETQLEKREAEREAELRKMLPEAALKDYWTYHFPIDQIQRLKRHHLWPIVYFMERVLFKLEKWGILGR